MQTCNLVLKVLRWGGKMIALDSDTEIASTQVSLR